MFEELREVWQDVDSKSYLIGTMIGLDWIGLALLPICMFIGHFLGWLFAVGLN